MDQSELEALLGRSLTSRETQNLTLYLNIAKQSLEDLLCLSLECGQNNEARTFESRKGYQTVFTGIFTEVTEVKVDGTVVDSDTYYPAQWDNRNAKWYNSLVFDDCFTRSYDVEVTADWNFADLPSDLKLMLAQLFANTSQKYSSKDVKSKKVEDFSITYGELTDDQVFLEANKRTIAKYSLCNVGDIRHGRIRCV